MRLPAIASTLVVLSLANFFSVDATLGRRRPSAADLLAPNVDENEQRVIADIRERAALIGWYRACESMSPHATARGHRGWAAQLLADDIPERVEKVCAMLTMDGEGDVDGLLVMLAASGHMRAFSMLEAVLAVVPAHAFSEELGIREALRSAARDGVTRNLQAMHRELVDAPLERWDADVFEEAVSARLSPEEIVEETGILAYMVEQRFPSMPEGHHVTVLMQAVARGYLKTLHLLLEMANASEDLRLPYVLSMDDLANAVLVAARAGNPVILTTLLEAYDVRGTSSSKGDASTLANDSSSTRNAMLLSALHLAISRDNVRIVRALLVAGADVSGRESRHLIDLARTRGNPLIRRMILRAHDGETTIAKPRLQISDEVRVHEFKEEPREEEYLEASDAGEPIEAEQALEAEYQMDELEIEMRRDALQRQRNRTLWRWTCAAALAMGVGRICTSLAKWA